MAKKTVAQYRAKLPPLTAERARELLIYDPETGALRWRVPRGVPSGALAGTRTADGYTQVEIDYRLYRAHRVIWLMMTGKWPKHLIDHKNKMRADNRWKNLREATHAQNSRNRLPQSRSKSGSVGVYACGDQWYASIGLDGKNKYLGRFDTLDKAVAARADAEKAHYGEFAPGAADAA
jgi:hypothetical protein